MARNFSKLLGELDSLPDPITGEYSPIRRRNVDKTSASGKVSRARPAGLRKSRIVDWDTAMLKADVAVGALKTVAMKGGKVVPKEKPVAATPPEHVALRVARAIGEMKQHAQGRDLNGPVTEAQLKACHALARAGEMSQEEVADVEKALSDKRALPLYILKKLGSGNT